MKKSRIIVPGMAVIAFSTAAAIAGSVAWFTASRTVTISAGNYAVVKTTANLDVKLYDGVGTIVTNADDSYSVSFGGVLTDGSFNHLNGNIYAPDANGTGIDENNIVALGDYDSFDEDDVADLTTALERSELDNGKKVYTAATFGIEFSMKFGANWESAKDVGLFLDNAAQKSSIVVTDGAEAKTAKGFRIAFYPAETPATGCGIDSKVFADLQESSKCSYVSDEDDFDGTAYVTGDLMDSSYNAAMPTSETARADAIARADYLGHFKSSQNEVILRYVAVCWFEGTDENIVDQPNATDYQTVTVNLVFQAVDLNNAA